MKPALRVVFLALGLWICSLLLRQVDPEALKANLRVLGIWAPTVLVPYFVVYLIDTAGWRACFGRTGLPSISFATLARIRWCGESLNNLVPSVYVGGEALKVFLLRRRHIESDRSTAAAIISKTVQTLAQLLVLALAALVFLRFVPPGSPLRQGLLLVLIGSLAVVVLLFWMQQRGIFNTLARLTRAVGFKGGFWERYRPRWRRVDDIITEFYRRDRPHFFKGLAFYCAGWLTDTLEVWWFSWLVGQPISWFQALSLEAFVGVAKILGMFVPGAIGIQESGIVLIGRAIGLSDSFCVAYAIIRRARELLFALAGWGLFVLEGVPLRSLRQAPPPAE